uniref:Uncharacterized protein n=1 Tax=Triticum urartu TaxID=4572 RepID=A0A8R7TY71_TRIUA
MHGLCGDVRVAVDARADLVGEGDVALGGERGGAGDVGPAGGAVGDVLEAAADGAAVGAVVGLGQQVLDAGAAAPGRRPALLHVLQARHQRAVHRGAGYGVHRRRRRHQHRREHHRQHQCRALVAAMPTGLK